MIGQLKPTKSSLSPRTGRFELATSVVAFLACLDLLDRFARPSTHPVLVLILSLLFGLVAPTILFVLGWRALHRLRRMSSIAPPQSTASNNTLADSNQTHLCAGPRQRGAPVMPSALVGSRGSHVLTASPPKRATMRQDSFTIIKFLWEYSQAQGLPLGGNPITRSSGQTLKVTPDSVCRPRTRPLQAQTNSRETL